MQDQGEIHGHLPLLACTANAREDQILKMTEAGFDGVVSEIASKFAADLTIVTQVSKPFKIPAIMEAMRNLLADLAAKRT